MTVYVDDMRSRCGRMILCGMHADTEEELHEMAAKVGVPRRWYQGDHYVVCIKMRKIAVGLGALEVTQRQLVAKFAPERVWAVAWLQARIAELEERVNDPENARRVLHMEAQKFMGDPCQGVGFAAQVETRVVTPTPEERAGKQEDWW